MQSSFISDLLATIVDRGRSVLSRPRAADKALSKATANDLCHALISRRGEASGVAIAAEILARWERMGGDERLRLLRDLAENFEPDLARLERAIAAWQAAPGPQTRLGLHAAAEPPRQELLRRLNLAPGGTARLVQMREELFRHLRAHPVLEVVDLDFAHLFSSWFNRGFLVLRRIDWTTPANILAKIIKYEAVHEIRDWDDLRRRIEPDDRRLFAFFHPQLPDEPLIFVEVALTDEMPAAIGPLLAEDRQPKPAAETTTAVFYSISNTQPGLKGISFGNFLIKQVAEDLKRELPNLKTFVTLSPVPGFAAWLAGQRQDPDTALLKPDIIEALSALGEPGRDLDEATLATARPALASAAAAYLLNAQTPGGKPLDPVARFHLGNGARLERLNPMGDTSRKGRDQSCGIMVNYLYDLNSIEANHEAFVEKGVVAASAAVRSALAATPPGRGLPAGKRLPESRA